MELIRKVEFDSCGSIFRLTLWDTYRTQPRYGKPELAYKFEMKHPDRWELLFEGDQFYCSPCYAIDSDDCILALLSFLTLKPGDTGQDYFDDYTKDQLAWAESSECEYLACEISCMEDPETEEQKTAIVFNDLDTE